MPSDRSLSELLADIADGSPMDWAEAERAAATAGDPRLLEDLRLLADVARLPGSSDSSSPDAAPTLLLDDRSVPFTWGHLAVLRLLGRGGFGDVYLARDTRLDRLVALKLLRDDMGVVPGLEDRLLTEARILASIDHPNVATIHGADVHDGRAGFWMEYIDGATLEEVLTTRGAFGAGEVVAVGHDLCRALAAVHGAGLIHRDVKARNVMRDAAGRHVLMDFGAWLYAADPVHAATQRLGTPLYLAPEVLAGAPATVASDIYATGVLLFHLLTATYPCLGESVDDLRRAHDRGERLLLHDLRPDLPTRLAAVVERALARTPEQRFRTAGEMAAALLASLDDASRQQARGTRFIDGAPSRMWPLLLVAATLVVALVLWGRADRSGGSASARTIAVRLFEGAPDEIDSAVTLGLTGDVVRELQRRGITVRGSTSIAMAAGFSLLDFRSRLQVDAVLKGIVAKPEADRLRVDVTLLRLDDQRTLWSRRFAPHLADVPDLARRIAMGVSTALGAGSEVRAGRVPSYAAYERYLRGRFLAEQRTPASLNRALDAYRRAIEEDPAYAQPWVGMADAYVALGVPTFGRLKPIESRRLAKEAVLEALDLDPDSAEAHATLGFIAYFHDWSWRTAEAEFRRSIALNEQYAPAHHWYADFLNAMGRFPEALREIQLAREIDPVSVLFHRDVGWHYFFQARYAEAVAQLQETLRLSPSYGPAQSLLGRALVEQGNYAEGLAAIEQAGLPNATGLTMRAYAEARAGDRTSAMQHLDEALGKISQTEYISPYYVALVHAALEDPQAAMQWLLRARDEQDPTLVNVAVDPRFRELRGRSDFHALVTELGFPTTP